MKSLEPLKAPLSRKELKALQDENGQIQVRVTVDLTELIDNDLEGLNDLVEARIISDNACLMLCGIGYAICDHVYVPGDAIANGLVVLEVTANFEETAGDDDRYFRVEYDKNYHGGEYSGQGSVAFISFDSLRGNGESHVREAFTRETGLPAYNMVHYSLDEEFTAEGEPYQEE